MGILGGQAGGRLPGWIGSISSNATPVHTKQIALLIACALRAWVQFRYRESSFRHCQPKYEKSIHRGALSDAISPRWQFGRWRSAHLSRSSTLILRSIFTCRCKKSARSFRMRSSRKCSPSWRHQFFFRKVGVVDGIVYVQIAAAIALGALAMCTTASVGCRCLCRIHGAAMDDRAGNDASADESSCA